MAVQKSFLESARWLPPNWVSRPTEPQKLVEF
ncbi:uncharacterized protein G2W53_022203 [Senna tora]|uniref:Uncharacterized protein n=1 Tax=Senna tora TaxID=362788 RepID=A0A834WNZ3_9FABA|nr:uncharacterized protein G2W53_022203 [Senna tora]